MIVDCANNEELRNELVAFLKEKKIETYLQGNEVWTTRDLKKSELDEFLKKTGRISHKAKLVDKMRFLLSIPSNLEDLGLVSCEFCGYIGHSEEIDVHRRSHQAL